MKVDKFIIHADCNITRQYALECIEDFLEDDDGALVYVECRERKIQVRLKRRGKQLRVWAQFY